MNAGSNPSPEGNPVNGRGREDTFSKSNLTRLRPNTKTYRVLLAFVNGGRYHRFEAERELHDHALHSTVSALQNKHGIEIARVPINVPGYRGVPTRVMRYWLPDTSREKALKLLRGVV